MDRREFLKTAGLGAAALSLAGCADKSGNAQDGITGEMEYRINPNSDDKVSLLGYGCMRWQMIKDADGNDIVDQDSVNELVDYALEHGVNYFDSAPVYLRGQSERATGIALKRHPRDSYFIATKASNFSDASLETGIAMYKASLRNFETDYLDYYLLHSLSGGEAFKKRFLDNGLLDYLLEERKAGRIRNLGFSFHGEREGFDEMMAYHDQYHWDFVQIQMNYVDWDYMETKGNRRKEANASYLYDELDKRGIPGVIMEPLLGGRLANLPDAVMDRLSAQEAGKSAASWAFRFCGTYPRILTVLSGMTYMEHLEDNLQTYCGFKSLTEKELSILDDVAKQLATYKTVDCTACQYCMPCPYGINIPGIFAHYNKCVNEGIMPDPKDDPADSEDRKAFKKARREYLLSYDRAIPTIRQADHCIGCGKCLEKCPQGIKIPQQLQRIDSYVNRLKKSR
ncbi:MAG: aldo/keto reductase [Bacteroidales bacterium]|nr:aldo/keto reductase [Bacteroidales bacterium]